MHPAVPLLFGLALPSLVHGFSFSTNDPTSCGNLEVTWTGGTAPFTLSIFGGFVAGQQISIPSDSFSNGKGSFSTQLLLNDSARFVAVMSDATGFATGGISPIITTGAAASGASCDTTLSPPWVWDTQSQAAQCRSYQINSIGVNPASNPPISSISYPITITTLVPGGSFQNYTISSGTVYNIPSVNIQAGSTMLVTLYDAAGRNGGDSDFLVVAQTGETSCLQSKYLSSTVISTSSATASASSTSSTSTSTSTAASDATTVSGGTIGAIVAASIVGLGAIFAIGFFCWKRNSGRRRYARNRVDMAGDYDSPTLLAATPARRYEPDPFTLGAPNTEAFDWNSTAPNSATDLMSHGSEAGAAVGVAGAGLASTRHSYASRQAHGPSRESTYSAGPATSLAPTSRSSKTNATGMTRATQPRFIMHTDAADEVTEEPDEVIELPPQYTERRRLPEYGGDGEGSSGGPPLGDVKRR